MSKYTIEEIISFADDISVICINDVSYTVDYVITDSDDLREDEEPYIILQDDIYISIKYLASLDNAKFMKLVEI